MEIGQVTDVLGAALSHDVTKWTMALGIAAWVHSSQVRKEIKEQMASIVDSINNVAQALRLDLDRIDKRVGHVEGRLDSLEDNKGGKNDSRG